MSFGMNYYQDFNETAPAGNGIDNRGTAGIPGKDDDRKLFVGGLTRQTTEKELRDYFGKYGGIESVTVKMDPYTGQSRGFAFIVFSDAKSIEKVLSSNHYINRRKVDPKHVTKKVQNGKIFVGGLTPAITDEDIRNHFSQYGTIVEIQAPFDKVKNQRKGFCFITFDNKNVIYQLLKNPKQCIKGKEVDVKKVRLNPEGVALNPNARMARPDMHGWGMNPPFPGGYPPEYPQQYGPPAYNNYGEYGGGAAAAAAAAAAPPPPPPYGNEYSSYGYPNVGPNQPYGPKSRGPGRQFQRHQPY